MNRHSNPNRGGFTLLEVLIASSIFSIMTAALFALSMSLQKTFRACSNQLRCQSEQLRILDYMALDLRRALTVNAEPTRLTVTIPNYYDAAGNPSAPVIDKGRVEYGASALPVTVSYYKQGRAIYRESGGKRQEIGSDVDDFDIQIAEAGKTASVSLSFLPRFQFTSSPLGYREGTATHITTLLRNRRN
jgi:prepilin-type N-terminal cleavage/methylation domain-containing protein